MTAFVAAPALSAARAVRRRTPRAVACPQACNVQQIGSTGFYRAQQVKTAVPDLAGLQPAVILGSAGTHVNGASLMRVKVHATGAELVADASALVALSDTLAAGDAVKRALWSRAGDEEDAVVVAAPSRPGDLVTITLAGSGVTYASEPLRLRKVAPAVVAPAKKSKASKAGSPFEVPLPDQLLPLFATKYPEITSNKSLKLNPHAQPGQLLYERFAAAARALGDSKSVDLLLHGTADTNVDGILQNGLHGNAGVRSPPTSWFTSDFSTARSYMGGAKRVVGFAVLRDKTDNGPITTVVDHAHHLPVLEVV